MLRTLAAAEHDADIHTMALSRFIIWPHPERGVYMRGPGWAAKGRWLPSEWEACNMAWKLCAVEDCRVIVLNAAGQCVFRELHRARRFVVSGTNDIGKSFQEIGIQSGNGYTGRARVPNSRPSHDRNLATTSAAP